MSNRPPKPVDELVVATYNIHACVGIDNEHDPRRVAEAISKMKARVVALQEVDNRLQLDGESAQLEFLERSTGMTAINGPTIEHEEGDYGNAVLTDLPILDVRRHDLSLPGREPRGAIDVDLEFHDMRLRVVATHLGLDYRERAAQVEQIFSVIESPPDQPLVFLGDFNHWLGALRTLNLLHRHLGRPPAPKSFPSRWPLFSLDRVWVRPREALLEVKAVRTPLTRVASDHLPVRAVVDAARLGRGKVSNP